MFFILAFFVSGIFTFGITPVVIHFARKNKLVDDPKVRFHPAHTHQGVIPRAGGLSLFLGVTFAILLFIKITPLSLSIILSTLVLTVVGLFDDKKDINPYLRLIFISIAALIVISAGTTVPYITNPFNGQILNLKVWEFSIPILGNYQFYFWSAFFAYLWIMWTMNIVGWSAGVDGQMPGFVAIAALVLGLLSLRFDLTDPNQLMVTTMSAVIAGAFIGFLPWNFYPQKIMPGYGGKTLAGFYLAVLGILAYAKVGTALLVLGIPTLDAVYTLIRRLTAKKSLVLADRGHLHHRLLALGWGKRRIALFYWILSAILGAIALKVTSTQKIFTLILVGVVFGGFILWFNFFTQLSKPPGSDNG